MGEALGYRPLQDIVRDRLREAILRGEYRPGQRLGISGLANQYGVSAVPVREALRSLEAEGLVEFSPNRGAVLRALTLDELAETYLIRIPLETVATRAAVPHLAEADIQRLDELLAEMEANISNYPTWTELNYAFHLTIYRASGLPRVCQVLQTQWAVLLTYHRVYLCHAQNQDKRHAEHQAIVEACRRRDADGAAELMERHLSESRDALLALLGESAPNGESRPANHKLNLTEHQDLQTA